MKALSLSEGKPRLQFLKEVLGGILHFLQISIEHSVSKR